VINNKISVTKLVLHHHDQLIEAVIPKRYRDSKSNCQKPVESMPKRVTKFLSLKFCVRFNRIIEFALLVKIAITYMLNLMYSC